MPTFAIPEENISSLEQKLAVIQRKCAKYGCDFMYRRTGEHMVKRVETVDGMKVSWQVKMIDVEVEGKAIAENGWEIVGAIEKLDGGNFITPFTDRPIPERYRNAEMICEHCQSKRARKSVVLMYNEEKDEWKQVGKSCMLDFTGKFNAEDAAFIAQFFKSISDYVDSYVHVSGSDPYANYWETKTVLCYAIECIKHWGYQKEWTPTMDRTNTRIARCLFQQAQDTKIKSIMSDVKFDPMSTENVTLAETICSRLLALDAKDDYTTNLQVLLRTEAIQFEKFQFVASAVPYYNRLIQKEEADRVRKEQSKSQFVGEVGQRLTVDIASIELISTWENTYGYSTTTTCRYQITDVNGNVFMWDASGYLLSVGCEVFNDEEAHCWRKLGEPSQLVGTVKKHDEFRGVKQTWLTRCRVTARKQGEVVRTYKVDTDPDPVQEAFKLLDSLDNE